MYDIVIIGAGPAGSTLARMLDNKYKVLIVDKRNFYDINDKKKGVCCGGLLAPDAQNMLAHLSLGVPKEVLTGPQMFSVKTLDFVNKIERYYQREYINVDRESFDRWLISLIPDSVEKAFNSIYKSYQIKDNCFEIKLRNSNKEDYKVKAKILVGADGVMSRLREQTFNKNLMPEKYVSIQHWFKTDKDMPYYTSIFDKEVTDFYSWIIQKEDNLILGTAIPIEENANEKFNILVNKLKKQGYIDGSSHKEEGTLIMRTRKTTQINVLKGNVALIGEAAGFISPSSAEGISYALKSGAMLASSINIDFNDFSKDYLKKVKKIKFNIRIKNIKLIFMYNNFLRKIIMKTGVLSMKIIDNHK